MTVPMPMRHQFLSITLFPLLALASAAPIVGARPGLSGIHPELAMFNWSAECGTGAAVVWADLLWAVTYAPHSSMDSDDKLYSVTRDLTQTIHPESIGGTPANRMIHRESGQLFIGPYAIGKDDQVRAISYDAMPGRSTGNARHLFDPQGKIYYATMEEGLYEVDVRSLAVTELFADDQKQSGPPPENRRFSALPGYHGKGLYSGQGVLVYANNGEEDSLMTMHGALWRFPKNFGSKNSAGTPSDPFLFTGYDHRCLHVVHKNPQPLNVVLEVDATGNGEWRTLREIEAPHQSTSSSTPPMPKSGRSRSMAK